MMHTYTLFSVKVDKYQNSAALLYIWFLYPNITALFLVLI
jgi:hypothetical protein